MDTFIAFLSRLARRAAGPASASFLLLAPVSAIAASDGWMYDWRPGWLPGEPATMISQGMLPWEETLGPSYSAAAPGLLVAIDPVTRRPVRPTAEQRRAASDALLRAWSATNRVDAPLPTQALRGGGELLHLPDGFQVFITARRNAEGLFAIDCAPDAPDAADHDHATAAPAVEPAGHRAER